MKLHYRFVWERFPTAIKIDRVPPASLQPAGFLIFFPNEELNGFMQR